MQTICCLECDHEIEGELIRDEFEDWIDYPDECPSCGKPLDDGVDCDKREDFHSDG